MANTYLVPIWFFGYEVSLELIFALITLVLSIYSFRIFRLSEQRQTKFFGLAFAFISASYFLQSFVSLRMILNENINEVLSLVEISTINNLGLRLHMMFFLMGLVTLAYMTFKVKSGKTYAFMLILVVAAIMMSSYVVYLFHLLSTILLAYVLTYYLFNYRRKKKRKRRSLLIIIAFAFLLIGSMDFFFSFSTSMYYVIGHMLELVAYLIILINLITVLRK